MKQELSMSTNKKRLKQLQSWMSNEIFSGKGHKRVKNKNGEWVKIKKN